MLAYIVIAGMCLILAAVAVAHQRYSWAGASLSVLVVATISAIVVAVFADFARSHTSPLGMKYAPECCFGGGNLGDCAPIPPSAVRVLDDGYEITLQVGDHHMVTKTHVFRKLFSEVRYSTDGEYHACLYPDENVLRCLYVPPMGS